MLMGVVTIEKRMKADRRSRQLLAEEGYAQPDIVQYETSRIHLYWEAVNVTIVVDVDKNGEIGESRRGAPPLGIVPPEPDSAGDASAS
jgi:hypothetical protein